MNLSPSETSKNLKETFVKERSVSRFGTLEHLLRNFRPGERLLLYGLTILLSVSAIALLAAANTSISVRVPAAGGTLTEGLVGPARFINPILALSSADQDLTTLVYSGLTRAHADGSIVPDLAASYEISEDGLLYTFTLRSDAVFHDGTPLTAADVMFTVQQAQNPDIKSPHRADWEGVTVSSPDPRTVIFKLPRAYAPFLQNTSMGILPQQIWKNIPAEDVPFSPLNTKPIGSGPYKVTSVDTDTTGAITRYELVPFPKFTLGAPHLKRITFLFYPNEELMIRDFNDGAIDALGGVSPERLESLERNDTVSMTVALPRIYGVFFNQAHSPVLSDAAARKALDAAIAKDRLVAQVLQGFGSPLDGPLPPTIAMSFSDAGKREIVSTSYTQETVEAARGILTRGGWTFDESAGTWTKNKQELSFALATVDSPELVATADAIATAWRQVGIKVNVQVFPITELNSTVIRPREYDALLFGEVVGRELDLFAFWHSSQRKDRGLNLALYTNSRADALLSQARATIKRDEREKLYGEFEKIIQEDRPAVFLYAPQFIYVVPEEMQGVQLGALTLSSERFLNVYEWYTDTEYVWSFLANKY